ncbi:MAG: ECF transporter S component [Candidatus Cellulosilyticum pullistercoris]|uniref:Riboflavin transporter n=1 Tax=Candidatus Cellulosilyticum pullistercoris TaxID=2838521 RepID=A0A9E2NJU2_9FIRM|nr:ECF transporter S component [Candidatus Cellulosilyticum pullistercoris]
MQNESKLFNTQNLVKMGILSALAFVLMRVLEIPLPIFPAFLKIDFGDVPAVIAALIINPFAGVVVVVIKNLLALFNSSTGGVGEIANVVVGISFVLPIGLCTYKNSRLKNVVIGMVIGVICMIISGMITNALITMPLFGEEACIGAGAALNPRIVDKWTFLLYVIAPFNLLKGVLVSSVGIIIVKGMQPVIKHLKVHQA